MTMKFRTVKTSIIEILAANSNSCFTVVGHQRQTRSAEELVGVNRTVQVFWSESDFPKSSGAPFGPRSNDATYRLELTVAAPAEGDISILSNPNATAFELQIALATMQEASAVADNSLDELVDLVFQILSDATNYDLGQTVGDVSNTWIGSAQKDEPLPQGELVVLTASMFLTVRLSETITGAMALLGSGDIQETTLDIDGDDVERTGIIVND